MKSESIDMVLTDPPYHKTTLELDDVENDYSAIYKQLARVMKRNAWFFLWGTPEMCNQALGDSLIRKFEYVWSKVGYPPRRHNTVRPAMAHELCFALHRKDLKAANDLYFEPKALRTKEGKPYTRMQKHCAKTNHRISERYFNVPTINTGGREGTTILHFGNKSKMPKSERTDHPTQKPQALLERIIRGYCPPGGIICDPFAGSGSTFMAAKAAGRSCIGWEKNPRWYDLVLRRVSSSLDNFP